MAPTNRSAPHPQRAHERGFRFWTRLERSSIYKALGLLEREKLIVARSASVAGPERRVYRATRKGVERLRRDGLAHLASPSHPRNEIDLGIYALPFLAEPDAKQAVVACIDGLRRREAFLEERLAWCRAHDLDLPALAFERPLLALRAEIDWLERVSQDLSRLKAHTPIESQWARYEYKEPPTAAASDAGSEDSRATSRREKRRIK